MKEDSSLYSKQAMVKTRSAMMSGKKQHTDTRMGTIEVQEGALSHPVLRAKPGVNHMCARINLSHMGDQMNIIITVVHKLNEYQSYYIINRV